MKMNKKETIKQEIEKTLDSVSSIKKQDAKPFLFTRIQAKLENKESKWAINWLFDSPILKPAALVLIITINILSIVYINEYYSMKTSEENMLAGFANDYSISLSTESAINLYNE